MEKILAIGEALEIFKSIWDSTSEFFYELVPRNFYDLMDKMAFLTSDFLAIGSNGKILDNSKKIAEAMVNLSNFIVWGILIFYAFKSLFGYFLSKRVESPWKLFVRMIVFGILANASFFICYTGIFFVENFTEYIREYVGEEKVSFSCLKEFILEEKIEIEEGNNKLYTFEAMMSVFIYFSTFLLAIFLGSRYILIKVLILFSPIFFVLGGFKGSENLFFYWGKKFLYLLMAQIVLTVILSVVNLCSFSYDGVSQILVCSMLFLMCKNFIKIILLKC